MFRFYSVETNIKEKKRFYASIVKKSSYSIFTEKQKKNWEINYNLCEL